MCPKCENVEVVQEGRRLTFSQAIISTSCHYEEVLGWEIVHCVANSWTWRRPHMSTLDLDPFGILYDSILSE